MSHSPAGECTCSALRQAARALTRRYDEALAPVGLGVNQYAILAKLDRLGPQTLQTLARALVMDRSTAGHLMRPLEKRGLVSMAAGVPDARTRVVSLADAGRAVLAEARPLWATAQARFEQNFGSVEAAQLRAIAARVATLDAAKPRRDTIEHGTAGEQA